MDRELTPEEIGRRFDQIDAAQPEQPTEQDLAAIARAEAEDPAETVTLEEYRKSYSGRLLLRIPKQLHRELAAAARENGVSLNQYALYKLAK